MLIIFFSTLIIMHLIYFIQALCSKCWKSVFTIIYSAKVMGNMKQNSNYWSYYSGILSDINNWLWFLITQGHDIVHFSTPYITLILVHICEHCFSVCSPLIIYWILRILSWNWVLWSSWVQSYMWLNIQIAEFSCVWVKCTVRCAVRAL